MAKHSIRKILLILKITALLLLIVSLSVSARSFGQPITLSGKNLALEKIFLAIEQQSDYLFLYEDGIMKLARPVSIKVSKAGIAEVLAICFNNQPLSYKIFDKHIVVRKKETNPEQSLSVLALKGKVINENGIPISGVSVGIKGSKIGTSTNEKGEFSFPEVDEHAVLVLTNINTESQEVPVNGRTELTITLKARVAGLGAVTVVLNNGYQNISKERATGSFNFVDNKLFNRSVGTNTLDRLENLVPGVLFDRNAHAPDPIIIRGRSTIYANAAPLIILDNFPYDGDPNNINPNDVESMTILKDAAAASIWGARAGNGVIVITSKKGTGSKPQVQFNSNFTFIQKPDLYNIHSISSADYIELEKYLFANDQYASDEQSNLDNFGHPPFTPVVELLIAKRDGLIPAATADAQIESFKQYDARKDIGKYLYRAGLNQQYHINVSGNSNMMNYYLSAGWDRKLSNLVGSELNRITLRSQNEFRPTANLQITAGINFIQSLDQHGDNPGYSLTNGAGKALYPYAHLADSKGNPINLIKNYRAGYTDTAGGGALLNWKYNPVTDISAEDHQSRTRDYLINAGFKYNILHSLSFEGKYQYENQLLSQNDLYGESSFFARDQTNNYAQVDPITGALSFPLPAGGIIDVNNTEVISHQGRAQLNYGQTWKSRHQLNAIAGWEIKSMVASGSAYRQYGYESDRSIVSQQIDYSTEFPQYSNPFSVSRIVNADQVSRKTDHFISYYANAAYTYDNRYTLSGSAREDEANLFGVQTNQKGAPLWSAGLAWQINNETFYELKWMPLLKLRGTYGQSGNISRLTSAYTTASFFESETTPLISATILNPPNAKLRWEQTAMLNIGLDFATKNRILSGSIEYYQKHGKDLMGQAPMDPTLGLINTGESSSHYYGNVAEMKGQGIDIELISHNLNGRFKWYTNFLYSYARTKITKYLLPADQAGSVYVNASGTYYSINPIQGKPVYSIFSYPWAGLDPTTGDPRGILGGKPTSDYGTIFQAPLDSLVYNGNVQPTFYGSFRNTFIWKHFSLSVNISYKGGYYFRKPVLNYSGLYDSWNGSSDYARRWQQPGDEKTTQVPSRIFPADPYRDAFYESAQANVLKGDNIRLEDINLSYELDKSAWHPLPFSSMRIYCYASNLGMIWSANSDKLDPYYVGLPKGGKKIAVGLDIHF